MASIFLRLRDVRFIRYLLASVGALAVDMGVFLALLAAGLWAPGAGAAGYAAGIAAHWLLSSRAVFVGNVALRGRRRTQQKALFVASAMVGLALTTAIVWLGDNAGIDPRMAKLAAIAVSFTATWLLRAKIVFR
jgi:putative flippase GtrA